MRTIIVTCAVCQGMIADDERHYDCEAQDTRPTLAQRIAQYRHARYVREATRPGVMRAPMRVTARVR